MTKKRGRELGLPFLGKTGPHNAITDVSGVEVGFTTITEGKDDAENKKGVQTGVTAILPKGRLAPPAYLYAGLHALNGNGEMTGAHWIDDAGYFVSPICITNTHSVGMVHHATLKWMIERHSDFFQKADRFVLPVIAETYDGLLNDIHGQHVTEQHVLAALDEAKGGPVAEGNVGGGNGMLTYEFKGGTGTSSRHIIIDDQSYTVGVLVQSNFGKRQDFTVCGVPIGRMMPEDTILDQINANEFGSIIVIIATDAPLIPSQLKRVAKRAGLGLARTGALAANSSGDIFFAFSTAQDAVDLSDTKISRSVDVLEDAKLDHIYRGARDATEEAIINAMLAAETSHSVSPPGITAYAVDHEKLLDQVLSHHPKGL
ncbi:MAG: P1 family peptidase [Pseudomonadota bacterium]